jgi:hypothetical protein
MTRPQPPGYLIAYEDLDLLDRFEPAPDLLAWIMGTFIKEGATLENPEHAHLQFANLGVLWTNCDNSRNMRSVIGQAELMPPMAMGKWQRNRAAQQVEEWFGYMPDFLLTFSAPAAAEMDDASFCALVEHELFHCGVKRDRDGNPKFKQDGTPSFAIRGHDVEEFVGVVARYGAVAAGVTAMVRAAQEQPSVGRAKLAGACGTCILRAA